MTSSDNTCHVYNVDETNILETSDMIMYLDEDKTTARSRKTRPKLYVCYGCRSVFMPTAWDEHQLNHPGCARRVELAGEKCGALVPRTCAYLIGSIPTDIRVKLMQFQTRMQTVFPNIGRSSANRLSVKYLFISLIGS